VRGTRRKLVPGFGEGITHKGVGEERKREGEVVKCGRGEKRSPAFLFFRGKDRESATRGGKKGEDLEVRA